MRLSIAEIGIELLASDPGLVLTLPDSVARFVDDACAPRCRVHVRVGETHPTSGGRVLFDTGGVWKLFDDGGARLFHFFAAQHPGRPYCSARFDASFANGEVIISADLHRKEAPLYPLAYPLDELLFLHLMSSASGLEVHGLGLIDTDERGVLFLGQSGAGKSTVTRFWETTAGTTVLSEDRVAIRLIDGVPRIFGTPWHGDARHGAPASAPLREVFFLEQSKAHAVSSLSATRAAARLMSVGFFPFYDPQAIAASFDVCSEVATRIRCRVLSFAEDASVVDFVRARCSAQP
jgi:hypothetical protein